MLCFKVARAADCLWGARARVSEHVYHGGSTRAWSDCKRDRNDPSASSARLQGNQERAVRAAGSWGRRKNGGASQRRCRASMVGTVRLALPRVCLDKVWIMVRKHATLSRYVSRHPMTRAASPRTVLLGQYAAISLIYADVHSTNTTSQVQQEEPGIHGSLGGRLFGVV